MASLDIGCSTSMISYSLIPQKYLVKLEQQVMTRCAENNILSIE